MSPHFPAEHTGNSPSFLSSRSSHPTKQAALVGSLRALTVGFHDLRVLDPAQRSHRTAIAPEFPDDRSIARAGRVFFSECRDHLEHRCPTVKMRTLRRTKHAIALNDTPRQAAKSAAARLGFRWSDGVRHLDRWHGSRSPGIDYQTEPYGFRRWQCPSFLFVTAIVSAAAQREVRQTSASRRAKTSFENCRNARPSGEGVRTVSALFHR